MRPAKVSSIYEGKKIQKRSRADRRMPYNLPPNPYPMCMSANNNPYNSYYGGVDQQCLQTYPPGMGCYTQTLLGGLPLGSSPFANPKMAPIPPKNYEPSRGLEPEVIVLDEENDIELPIVRTDETSKNDDEYVTIEQLLNQVIGGDQWKEAIESLEMNHKEEEEAREEEKSMTFESESSQVFLAVSEWENSGLKSWNDMCFDFEERSWYGSSFWDYIWKPDDHANIDDLLARREDDDNNNQASSSSSSSSPAVDVPKL